ncbi:MAG: hypothetical protein P4L84_18580 [Isosphaeraceae bacterium]|nr:hypothetical protein [Isosphaeraceae bacterium]
MADADATLTPDTTADHSTLSTAEDLPADASLLGTLNASGAPGVFRLPVSPGERSMVIAFSWVQPSSRIAGSVVLVSGSTDVVWSHELPGKPLAIDLQFSNLGADPGTPLYLEIVPAENHAAPPIAGSSEYALHVLQFPDPQGWSQGSGFAGFQPVQSLGSGPCPNRQAPLPASGRLPETGTGIVLPLPQVPPSPVAGIFTLGDSSVPVASIVSVVADPDLLDLVPVATGLTWSAARLTLASAGDGDASDPCCVGLPRDEATPLASQEPGAWAVDQVFGSAKDETPSNLALSSPPVGIRAFEKSIAADRFGDRATLPRLVVEPAIVECGRSKVTSTSQTAAHRPTANLRPRALLALVYSSVCSILGLTAPGLSATLHQAARGESNGCKREPIPQTGAVV